MLATHEVRIGDLVVPNNVFLAPLAGYTNYPFRKQCLKYGAGLTFPEMMNARGFLFNPKGTEALLHTEEEEKIKTVQLFGKDPALLRQVAESETLSKVDLVDLNMGCPMPKIVKNGEGSALLSDFPLASEIIREVKKSGKRVSVKFRVGLDEKRIVTEDFAKLCEDAGADMITVHGRTREQVYAGEVRYDEIARAKQAVRIPVIANGGVMDEESARLLLDRTGADGIMIARGALSNPQIFADLTGAKKDSKRQMILEELEDTMRLFSPHFTVVFMRKMVAFYIKGMRDSVRFKDRLFRAETEEALRALIDEIFPEG
ncbi:MAG: tRNA-dihydrouridine synthase [Clostridia bacterium]|nr:tRNA-dihydrouridine synthase [Clostridia bacterium]